MLKNLLKTLVAAGLTLTVALSASAAPGLRVKQKNGVEVSFPFADQPSVTYSGINATIASKVQTLQLSMAEIQDFSFGEAASLGEVEFNAATATVTGLQAGQSVSVYGLDGVRLFHAEADADGTVTVPFDRLPKTVLIVHTPGAAYKFTNR